MEQRTLNAVQIQRFASHLQSEERAAATIEKYLRDVREFSAWLDGEAVTKEVVLTWRELLLAKGRGPATVNTKLSALNSLFHFLGWDGCQVKFLKIQRAVFRDRSLELTRTDFQRLLETAQGLGRDRLALLMETICATGIRVSEVRCITVEAARRGRAEVRLKGKIRLILLPGKMCRKLLRYAEKKKITAGQIFVTGRGNPLSRKQIWREMKLLCEKAHVEESKVFPHNLRHLFATLFYRACKDIVKLADVLGHSSVETTRIYLVSTGREHARWMDRLGVIT